MKKETCKCKVCDKEYDAKDLKRSQGDVHWLHKFCSARCYTKDLTGV